jgi:hypothetical protein
VAEIKEKESNHDSINNGRRQIIDKDLIVNVAIATIQTKEPVEGGHLFHSQMWVKGTPLHYVVNSLSHKTLISIEVVK